MDLGLSIPSEPLFSCSALPKQGTPWIWGSPFPQNVFVFSPAQTRDTIVLGLPQSPFSACLALAKAGTPQVCLYLEAPLPGPQVSRSQSCSVSPQLQHQGHIQLSATSTLQQGHPVEMLPLGRGEPD